MKKLIKIEVHGLKCDNTSCGYKDMTIPLEEYTSYIEYPCPWCNQSLLTQEAHNDVIRGIKIANFINKYFGWLGSENDSDFDYEIVKKYTRFGIPSHTEIRKINGKKEI